MQQIKAAIFTVALLTGALLIYVFLTFNHNYEVHLALDAFLKGDLERSEAIMRQLGDALPKAELHLDLAYIARAKQQLSRSDEELKKAEENLASSPSLTSEVAFNRALNDTLSHRGEPFATLPAPLSPWMKKALDAAFEPQWHQIHLARLEIEAGRPLQAREELERLALSWDSFLQLDRQLLLGLSYLKEAQEMPPAAATPYYQLAFSYFARVPMQHPRYDRERIAIVNQIKQQAQALADQGLYRELASYTTLLNQWE